MPKTKTDKITKCKDFPNDFNFCANSTKTYSRADINNIAEDCGVKNPSCLRNRNSVCEAILQKKYGYEADVPSPNVNCEMTLGKCKAVKRSVLNDLAPKCGIFNPLKYTNIKDLCDAIIEKQKPSMSPEEKIRHARLEEIEKTKTANKRAREIIRESKSDSESSLNSESDLDSENNDDKVLTVEIIKTELRNIGSYDQLVEKFKTIKGIRNGLLNILQEKKYGISEFTDEQKKIIKDEVGIMMEEQLAYDSDLDLESESKSEHKPHNKIKEIKEIEKDLKSMGIYINRGGITIPDLKNLSDKYNCGIKKSLNKENLFNETKNCLNKKLEKLKSEKIVKTSKSTTAEDMKKIKEAEILAQKEVQEKSLKEAKELARKEKALKEAEILAEKALKEAQELDENEKALKESLKSNKELKISKKSTKSVKDLIVESIKELGPYSTIKEKYSDEDGDIDDRKFRKALRSKLAEKTTEKTTEIILLKDYKKVINETLADMEEEYEYIINKGKSDAESDAESEGESERESEGESDAESVGESETKPLEVEITDTVSVSELEKPLEVEIPLPITISEIEESDKSKIRKNFEEQRNVRKIRKKSLSSMPFQELKQMITFPPESELQTCDPINNQFCSDNFTCDISEEPNICIENKNATNIEDHFDYKRYTYNGKEIIGPKDLIESLKNKLESKKELTESLKNELEKQYITFRYQNLKIGQDDIIVVNKETGIIVFVWNITDDTTYDYDPENLQFLIKTKILQEIETKNETIITLEDVIDNEGDNIYASLYIDPNKLLVSESSDIDNILLSMTLTDYDENIINKYKNNIEESTEDDLENAKVILTEDLKFKFASYEDEKDIYDEEDNDTDDEDNSVYENISEDDERSIIGKDDNEDETVINKKDDIDSLLKELIIPGEDVPDNSDTLNEIMKCIGLITNNSK